MRHDAPVKVGDLPTPALVIDKNAFDHNLAEMRRARPGARLRPHVKAHKCTRLAAAQADIGHLSFTVATPREAMGLATAGLGADVLVANEVLDPQRLSALAKVASWPDSRVTVAIDSLETLAAAADAGLRDVVIDVNVGLPRCGCAPEDARKLAERAVAAGLIVRGVMGYEGHLMTAPRDEKPTKVLNAMTTLVQTFDAIGEVGGEHCTIISAGGTGTYWCYDDTHPILGRVNEVQAGSYALMDSHYGSQGLPFRQALFVIGTVISRTDSWAVIDVGLKSLGMDHGNPTIDGAKVWFCSDEHTTLSVDEGHSSPRVGERVAVVPAHVDPTVAMHEAMHVTEGFVTASGLDFSATVTDWWPVALRGW